MDRTLTPRERNFFYDQALERRRQELDETELVLRRAWASDHIQWLSSFHALISQSNAKSSKEFPYDVPYLTASEVDKLVNLSKQLFFDDACLLVLQEQLPPEIWQAIQPLKNCRFFDEEFAPELDKLLGIVTARQYGDPLRQAGRMFSRQDSPQWTPERARAHLQDHDEIAKRASTHPRLWQIYTDSQRYGKPLTKTQLIRWIHILRLEATLIRPVWFDGDQIQWEQHLETTGVKLQDAKEALFRLGKEARAD